MTEQRFLTTNEVLEVYRIGRTTLYQREKAGLITPRRIGRRKLYPVDELDNLLT